MTSTKCDPEFVILRELQAGACSSGEIFHAVAAHAPVVVQALERLQQANWVVCSLQDNCWRLTSIGSCHAVKATFPEQWAMLRRSLVTAIAAGLTDVAAEVCDAAVHESPAGKDDAGKDPWHLLPLGPVRALVRVLAFGARKYGENSWQTVPGRRDRYYAAALRHITAWRDGARQDPESGLHHLAHAMCCLVFLIYGDDQGDV